MQSLHVGLVQLPWLGSEQAMREEYNRLVAQAAKRGAAIVCLPEFSLMPYFPSTTDASGFSLAENLSDSRSQKYFCELAKANHVYVVGSLYEQTDDKRYFDTATIASPDGTLVGVTRKIHIPYGEGYNETHFFKGSNEYPVFKLNGVNVATPTCYDQWFPELSRIYSLNGAEFIFYPTAIGSEPTDATMDTQEAWQTVMRGQAIANGVFIAAANRTGVENGVRFYGSSFICDPAGRVIAQASRDQTEVIVAELRSEIFEKWRRLFPLLTQRRPETYEALCKSALAVTR